LKVGDHRLSGPEHLDTFRRLVLDAGGLKAEG
jgi:hypothetical protein